MDRETNNQVVFLPPNPTQVPEGIGTYIPGGRNVMAHRYTHSKGYPPFQDRAQFIGTLQGDWREMGRQFGARTGDSVRCVSDIWWVQQCRKWGKNETHKAMALYEAQIRALEPGLVAFMEGIAEGAAPWLNQSCLADAGHPLAATNYQRVLGVNVQDEWTMHHPLFFPDGSCTFGGSETTSVAVDIPTMCSGFSVRDKVALNGEVIAAQNRHSSYDPRCYEQVYVIRPEEGLACWVLSNCPQVVANQVVNEKGVSIALFSGGGTNPQSLNFNGEAHYAEGFGVPWFHLFLYAGTHAHTAEEAIQMLTLGTPDYRKRTGRNTLLRGGGWIFMVTDATTLAVVEGTADRFAVRYAGEFTGSEWTDPDTIVATNHNLCNFSYDDQNRWTQVSMTLFADGLVRDKTGVVTGLSPSGQRFWTLMWDIKHNRGQIDPYMAQHIMSGLHANDPETGKRIECVLDENDTWRVWGAVRGCNQGGGVGLSNGSADAKVAVLAGGDTAVFWTMGSPSHWAGAWDRYVFDLR